LHDCPAGTAETGGWRSSYDGFLDALSEALEADIRRDVREREKRGLKAASESLKTALEAAARRDVDAAFDTLAYYERDLQEQHRKEDYETYRGVFWAFYEPVAATLDEITVNEGWGFLAEVVDAYPRESTADEPLCSPVIENAVGRYVVRTRLRDGVEALPVEALDYLGSFWESMGDTSGEESFTYGWGIGHPDHSVADHLHDVVTEELFWVRGTLPHAFYADQCAAADLLEALIRAKRIDYGDRYLLASTVADVDRDSTPEIPRYWDFREELGYRFEWDETVERQLRRAIEAEGFHERLPEDWTFSDMEV
jgi:hypothetical protein